MTVALSHILSHLAPIFHHLADVLSNNAVQFLAGLAIQWWAGP